MSLDRTTLPIQGPPGSGKTYTGARMILDLVASGCRVGVTSNSHKVIGNLLDEVVKAARERPDILGREIRVGQKPGNSQKPTCGDATCYKENDDALRGIAAREVDVLGGTAWMWAREDFVGAVDVLFIDEAGQFALANAVSVAPAARSLVLLGDPQQLDQPTQGTHPTGAERSALAHLLEVNGTSLRTMPPDRGLFLERTWRMHPAITAYTSEMFYDGKLDPEPGNERQRLSGVGLLDDVGIRWAPVVHATRDDTESTDEARVVVDMVAQLLASGGTWTDRDEIERPITESDVLILTPYNDHRVALEEGPAGPYLHLHHGQLERRRCAARHGVPLLAQPPQRRDVPRQVPDRGRRVTRPDQGPLQDPSPDAARQRPLPARGGRGGCLSGRASRGRLVRKSSGTRSWCAASTVACRTTSSASESPCCRPTGSSSPIGSTSDGEARQKPCAMQRSAARRSLAKDRPQVLVVVVEPTKSPAAHTGSECEVGDVGVRAHTPDDLFLVGPRHVRSVSVQCLYRHRNVVR
jgi:hypothetical protein